MRSLIVALPRRSPAPGLTALRRGGAPPLGRPTRAGFRSAAKLLGGHLLFGGLPAVLAGLFLYQQSRLGVFGFDFEGTVWQPARDMLAGRSAYPAPTPAAVDVGNPAVYPPSVLLVALPFAALPLHLAAALWFGVLVASVAAALALLGVRDWRCYVLALASLPVLHGAVFGNLTLLLLPAVALAWRERRRAWVVGACVAFVVAMKIFLWPLLVWLAVTRRTRTALGAAAGAAAVVVASWAAIGFDGLRAYPRLLATLTDVFAAHGQSLYAGALALGLPVGAAQAVSVLAGVALLAVAALVAGRADGDRRAFSAAIAASLALSPIVWPHYYVLLLVPLALLRRRLSPAWAVLPSLWPIVYLLPHAAVDGVPCCGPRDAPAAIWQPLHGPVAGWQIAGYVAVLAFVTALSVFRVAGARHERVPA